MDPGYGSIFENLYSARPETGYAGQIRSAVRPDSPSGGDSEVISRAIDDAEAELTGKTAQTLRSDAKYFLLVNLLQMVFVPFRLHGGPLLAEGAFVPFGSNPGGGTFADLTSVLREDLRLILNDAALRQQARGYSPLPQDREISSHLVMEAVVANWNQLGLNSFRIWGER